MVINTLQARINRAHARIYEGLQTHPRAALQISGGKDSLACLYLSKPFWPVITVAWASSGDERPDTRRQMDSIRAMVPNFLEVKGNAKQTQNDIGWPVDMLPMKDTPHGVKNDPEVPHISLVGVFDCCSANFWQPMQSAMTERGINLLIRGQRDNERLRNTDFAHGVIDTETDTRCVLPIHDWSITEVFEYLDHVGAEIPMQYEYGLSSLDCLHCTGYLHEKQNLLPFLRKHYPDASNEVERRLLLIDQAQSTERAYLAKALNAKEICQATLDPKRTP